MMELFWTPEATQDRDEIYEHIELDNPVAALALDELADVAGMTGDTILGVGEDTADFAEQWEVFKNNTLVLLEPLATRVFGTLGDLMGQVVAGVEPMAAAWESADATMTQSGW